jgi:hypothetical protein
MRNEKELQKRVVLEHNAILIAKIFSCLLSCHGDGMQKSSNESSLRFVSGLDGVWAILWAEKFQPTRETKQ